MKYILSIIAVALIATQVTPCCFFKSKKLPPHLKKEREERKEREEYQRNKQTEKTDPKFPLKKENIKNK